MRDIINLNYLWYSPVPSRNFQYCMCLLKSALSGNLLSLKKKKNTFIYLFIFGYAGSSLLTVLCLAVESGNYSPVAVGGLLIAAVSLIVEHGL